VAPAGAIEGKTPIRQFLERRIHHRNVNDLRETTSHLEGDGRRFFELVCEKDLEGIICKPKPARTLLLG